MTKELIEKRIEEIKTILEDDESAHSLEDDLYFDFIKYIAKTGTKEQRTLAKLVLTVNELDFVHWYA